MDHNDTKYILKKLMQDALAEEERAALSDRKAVKQQMLGQWENAPDAVSSDRVDGRQIWYQICQRLWNKASDRRYLYYKIYSIAASLLLLLAVGSMAYLVGSK